MAGWPLLLLAVGPGQRYLDESLVFRRHPWPSWSCIWLLNKPAGIVPILIHPLILRPPANLHDWQHVECMGPHKMGAWQHLSIPVWAKCAWNSQSAQKSFSWGPMVISSILHCSALLVLLALYIPMRYSCCFDACWQGWHKDHEEVTWMRWLAFATVENAEILAKLRRCYTVFVSLHCLTCRR